MLLSRKYGGYVTIPQPVNAADRPKIGPPADFVVEAVEKAPKQILG